ncbi:Hypothetical predicted protein [Olea europaea subsp. europaea]|uniref:Uncharacterized protein n=1 Tax=Olea europaea subsp. europaea TaxID=158383 RepID=A0A8S0R636_OLEEU|nr:Hypothetical predicted protein [Olea europaea subsp. europaea]
MKLRIRALEPKRAFQHVASIQNLLALSLQFRHNLREGLSMFNFLALLLTSHSFIVLFICQGSILDWMVLEEGDVKFAIFVWHV